MGGTTLTTTTFHLCIFSYSSHRDTTTYSPWFCTAYFQLNPCLTKRNYSSASIIKELSQTLESSPFRSLLLDKPFWVPWMGRTGGYYPAMKRKGWSRWLMRRALGCFTPTSCRILDKFLLGKKVLGFGFFSYKRFLKNYWKLTGTLRAAVL